MIAVAKKCENVVDAKLHSITLVIQKAKEEMEKYISEIRSEVEKEHARAITITTPSIKKPEIPLVQKPSFTIANRAVFISILADRINTEIMHAITVVTNAVNSLNEKNFRKKVITMKFASRSNDILDIFNNFIPMGTYTLPQLPDEINKPVIIVKDGVVVSRAVADLDLYMDKCEAGTAIISVDDEKPFSISYKATKGGNNPRSNIIVTLDFYRKCIAPNCSRTGWYKC